MRISGQLSQVKAKQTSFGEMYDLIVNGQSYGLGKYPPRGIKAGDFVTLEFEQKGNYKNVVKGSLRLDDNPAPQTAPAPAAAAPTAYAGKSAYVPFDERQEIISKQAAMNTALSLCTLAQTAGAVQFTKTAKPSDILGLVHQWVLETAQQVYKLTTGRDWDAPEGALSAAVGKAPSKAKAVKADSESPIPVEEDTGYNEYNG